MFFARRDRDIVAVEIGTGKMVAVVANVGRDGLVRILGVGEGPSAGVRKGEIIEPEAAREALRDVIAQAEETSGVEIMEVYLALSGAHLDCALQTATAEIRGEEQHIDEEDVAVVCRAAEEMLLAPDRLHVATLPGVFRIDGGEPVARPIGMVGHRLDGEFLVVSGVASRLKNVISRVQELEIRVADVVLSPVASAERVLGPELREAGALVIDMGAGLTHFAVVLEDRVAHLGVVGVGGDHVTQDISRAFNLPRSNAEELKTQHGTVEPAAFEEGELIELKARSGFAGKRLVARELAAVMRARWEETLEIVREAVPEEMLAMLGGGVVLTGGGSRTRGIGSLAERVLGLSVAPAHTGGLAGNIDTISKPELSTVLGSLVWAQCRLEEERERENFGRRFKRALQYVRMML